LKVLLFVFIASAIILAALAATFPEVLLNPGPLMKSHQKLEKKCLSCHEPFAGVTSTQCIRCHKQADIGVRKVSDIVLSKDTAKALFHRGVIAASCIDCHVDHRGIDAAKALKSFKHEALSQVRQKECITCHQNKTPRNALHQYTKGQCSECHTTSRWKPAAFDHNRYFPLDGNHTANCAACHNEPGNYKKYTCYNCHEHSYSLMVRKHEKEGIVNFQNCMKCHRNGNREGQGREGSGDKDDD